MDLHCLLTSQNRNKWLGHDTENEMVECLAHDLLRNLADDIRSHGYFSIIVDETTDLSTTEQLTLCIRHVSDNFHVYEDVIGMYATDKTDAATITAIIQDILVRLQLLLSNLRAQCYDGASNMSGCHSGVQRRILQLQPKAIYIHCRNHILNLALQDAASSIQSVRNVLSLTNDLASFILQGFCKKNRHF
jgi:hypothetical protein